MCKSSTVYEYANEGSKGVVPRVISTLPILSRHLWPHFLSGCFASRDMLVDMFMSCRHSRLQAFSR